jgi:hypothetical protein
MRFVASGHGPSTGGARVCAVRAPDRARARTSSPPLPPARPAQQPPLSQHPSAACTGSFELIALPIATDSVFNLSSIEISKLKEAGTVTKKGHEHHIHEPIQLHRRRPNPDAFVRAARGPRTRHGRRRAVWRGQSSRFAVHEEW